MKRIDCGEQIIQIRNKTYEKIDAPYHFYPFDCQIKGNWKRALDLYNVNSVYDAVNPNGKHLSCSDERKMYAILFGVDNHGRSVSIRVSDFKPFVFIQLKDDFNSDGLSSEVLNYIQSKILRTSIELTKKFLRYKTTDGWKPQKGTSKTKNYHVIKLYLDSTEQYNKLKNWNINYEKLNRGEISVRDFGENIKDNDFVGIPHYMKRVNILETDVSYANKFVDETGLNMCQWLTLSEFSQPEQYLTTTQIELECTMGDLSVCTAISQESIPQLITSSFDTEWRSFHKMDYDEETKCYPRRFPQKYAVEDGLICFSTTVQKLGDKKRYKFLHYVKSSKANEPYRYVPRTESERIAIEKGLEEVYSFEYETEWDCINGWSTHMQEQADPDVITHYNGNGFDWKYIIKRVELLSDAKQYAHSYIEFLKMCIVTKMRNRKDFSNLQKLLEKVQDTFRAQNLGIHVTKKKAERKKNSTGFFNAKQNDKDESPMVPNSLIRELDLNQFTPKFLEKYYKQYNRDYKNSIRLNCAQKNRIYALSRLIGVPAKYTTKEISNNAKGYNSHNYLSTSGRMNVDMMHQIKETSKLSEYTLKYVSKYFLTEEEKVDLSPEKISEEYFAGRYDDLFYYALIDADLTLALMNHFQIIFFILSMSYITLTTVIEILTQGEQIKVWNQLVFYGHRYGWVMSNKDAVLAAAQKTDQPKTVGEKNQEEDEYEGACVLDAVVGYYASPIGTKDYASLYPSIIIANNLCTTTLIKNLESVGINIDDYEIDPKNSSASATHYRLKDGRSDGIEFKAVKINDKTTHYFAQHEEGLIAIIEKKLRDDRKAVRKIQSTHEEGTLIWIILDKKQLNIKLSMNSIYGFFGVKMGRRPCKPIAESVTSIGRGMIIQTVDYAYEYANQNGLKIKVVYGDSVTEDTPIFCRLESGLLVYRTVDELSDGCWYDYHGDKEASSTFEPIEVWTERGFTKINRVIRHKTEKQLYRVTTKTGSVDVTQDHSLLNPQAEKVTPVEIAVGQRLLHKNLSQTPEDEQVPCVNALFARKLGQWWISKTESIHDFEFGGMKMCNHSSGSKKIPDCIMNADTEVKKQFLIGCGFDLSQTRFEVDGKLNAASFFQLVSGLGIEVTIDSIGENNRYVLCFGENADEHQDEIVSISALGKTNGFVYDLETENHHFAAGPGRMIVHNTDSIMVCFLDYTNSPMDIVRSMFHSQRMADYTTKKFPDAIQLEHENIYSPYTLYKKKRYIGKHWTIANFKIQFPNGYVGKIDEGGIGNLKDQDISTLLSVEVIKPPKVVMKGVESKRRDNFPFMRECYVKCINMLLDFEVDNDKIKLMMLDKLNLIVDNKLPITSYVYTSSLKKEYKEAPAPEIVRQKVEKRNPGSGPRPGERVSYVFLEGPEKKKKDRAMDLKYVLDHPSKCKIDRAAYLIRMAKAFRDLLTPVYEDAGSWFLKAAELVSNKKRGMTSLYGDDHNALLEGLHMQTTRKNNSNTTQSSTSEQDPTETVYRKGNLATNMKTPAPTKKKTKSKSKRTAKKRIPRVASLLG